MKGVIVQAGVPKSIVLYNNGKIGAIPTPAGCHVGMVVTVKFNDRLKIIILAFAAVLLIVFGIIIGAMFLGAEPAVVPRGHMMENMPHMQRGARNSMMMRGRIIPDDPPN